MGDVQMAKRNIVLFFFTLLVDYFIPLTTHVRLLIVVLSLSVSLGEFKPLEHRFCPERVGLGELYPPLFWYQVCKMSLSINVTYAAVRCFSN